MLISLCITVVGGLLPSIAAQAANWGQCGGIGFTGPTTCTPPFVCTYEDPYHSQCLPFTSDPTQLDAKFKSKGKLFWGTASDMDCCLSISQEANITQLDFGGVTSRTSMSWDVIHPVQDTYNWTESDDLILFGQLNGQKVHGQAFISDDHLPDWVRNITDAPTLTSVIQNHIQTVMQKYRGGQELYAFDVISGALNEDGTIKSTHFTRVLGKSVFIIALQAARLNGQGIKMYINDDNLDSNNAKVAGMVRLVEELNSNEQLKLIDGIGTKAHLPAGGVTHVQAALQALSAANVDVAITDLEIAGSSPADYSAIVQACLNVTAGVSITSAGVQGKGLLFNEDFSPKEAYTTILKMLST